jgi:hypothetical protein
MHRNSGYRVIITVEPSLYAAKYQLAEQSGTSGGADGYKADVLGGGDEYKADVSGGADEYKADASGGAEASEGVDEYKADASGLSPAHNAGGSAAADQIRTISELLSELMLSIDVTVLCRGETPSYTRSQLLGRHTCTPDTLLTPALTKPQFRSLHRRPVELAAKSPLSTHCHQSSCPSDAPHQALPISTLVKSDRSWTVQSRFQSRLPLIRTFW